MRRRQAVGALAHSPCWPLPRLAHAPPLTSCPRALHVQNAVVCQYGDQAATEAAVVGITAMAVAGSTLRARRPSQDVQAAAACAAVGLPSATPAQPAPPKPAEPPAAAAPAAQQQRQQQQPAPAAAAAQPPLPAGAAAAAPAAPAGPTCVLRLSNMLSRAELADPEEYDDIVDDIKCEVERWVEPSGLLASLHACVLAFLP